MSEANNKNLPRDTFLYLLAIITLVVVAVGFGMAVFNYIDFYFPDPATDYYRSASSYEGAIRQAMAMLIVVFPVFFWVSRFLRKDVRLHPEKKELKIRKWLLYLTLFAAALVIIGDFVTVVNNFLRGELTTRFALKALTIFFISGSVFYYYLAQLKEKGSGTLFLKYLTPFIVAVVIAAVGWGFAVIGSPFAQREKRFDEKRVQDLQTIQNQIIYYWQSKQSLPLILSDLEDTISGFKVPLDSQSGEEYEYSVSRGDEVGFELCAVFNNSDISGVETNVVVKPVAPRGEYYTNENWQHDAGRYCFERTIDPDLYPSIKQK
ncbi:MAG: hypothetical protein HYX22_00690 [Candidatus Yanofskybacteria bacterium]|nr:hypothetical protein [Candidatus Yanofskybacteria bacterium]